MTIAKLEQFLAVCQFQSVTRAAEYLHISQPSVSASVRELEREFAVNLFRHEGRKLILTAEGSFLKEQAQTLLKQYDTLCWQMRDLGNQKNLFRIRIPPMAGTIFFPQLYKAFEAQYPQITLSITECGSLQAEKLLLHGEPLVLFGPDSAPARTVLSLFARQQLRPNVLLRSSQLSMIKQFIADGSAAAFLLDPLAVHEEELVAIPLAEPVFFDTILMWQREQYLYSDVACFLRFARNFRFTGCP